MDIIDKIQPGIAAQGIGLAGIALQGVGLKPVNGGLPPLPPGEAYLQDADFFFLQDANGDFLTIDT